MARLALVSAGLWTPLGARSAFEARAQPLLSALGAERLDQEGFTADEQALLAQEGGAIWLPLSRAVGLARLLRVSLDRLAATSNHQGTRRPTMLASTATGSANADGKPGSPRHECSMRSSSRSAPTADCSAVRMNRQSAS